MPIQFSQPLVAQHQGGGGFLIKALALGPLGDKSSPVLVFDDFRVRGQPFAPHPHAGFSAVTYVFENSPASLRSRDSLGHDVVVGPGGLVWTKAGRGVMHEELPAERNRELHGLQLFVNLNAANKFSDPQLLKVESQDVPEWRNEAGDRVRVVVGSFEGLTSPLPPPAPFTLLDATLRSTICFPLAADRNALIYVVDGEASVRADGLEKAIAAEQALPIHGGGAVVAIKATLPTQVVIVSGEAIREPVVVDGPFIMNDRAQIAAAFKRFEAGEMGHLLPASAN